jgi:uncharacterized protein (UPF0216 family)
LKVGKWRHFKPEELKTLNQLLSQSSKTVDWLLKNQGAKVVGNKGDHGFNEKEYEHILNFIREN